MANEQNLKPFTSDQSREEAKKNGRKGGIASGEAKRKKKAFREAFEELLNKEIVDKKTGNTLTGAEVIAIKVFEKALKGDIRAYETIRDATGQRPDDRVQVEVKQDTDALDEILRQLKNND